MNLLSGIHGVVAIVLLSSLLFVEEAGVPLPFAPGELTLLAAGLLIAAGGLDPWVFIPLAFVVCVAGAMVGYSWARIVGDHGLTGLAVRFHQVKALERVSHRVRRAGPVGIGVSRLIPGLRIYTTLVAGAFGVRRRTFLEGLVPSTAIWVGAFVALGIVVGIPVEHFLTKLAQMAVQGAILLVLGVGGYFAIRRAPSSERESLVNLPGWIKTGLAALVDLGVVASILTGILAIARMVTGTGVIASWADGVVALAALGAAYLFITRRSTGATVGEALLHTIYLRRRSGGPVGGIEASAGPADSGLKSAAERLGSLASVPRLAIVKLLLEGSATSAQVADHTSMSGAETVFHLAALRKAGLIEVASVAGGEERFELMAESRGWLGAYLGELTALTPVNSGTAAPEPAGGL